jgi:hypothetical protein
MSKDTGGPAFPSTMTDDTLHVPGMTLRQYAAIKAMQGFLSNSRLPAMVPTGSSVVVESIKTADALLAELEARK